VYFYILGGSTPPLTAIKLNQKPVIIMEHKERINFVLDNYKSKIYQDQISFGKCDFQIYPDFTSDGYQLKVAKYNENILNKGMHDSDGSRGKIFLNEHVFHNNFDLALVFMEELRKGGISIYVDEQIYEDAMIDSYLEEEYERLTDLEDTDLQESLLAEEDLKDELYNNFYD
tara:strand:+ start:413 stop:928 length:516 start_codon:yes stop_codon:yes gene_type:complete